MKFGKTNLSSLAAIVILSNLTLLRCGEPTNNSPEKKSVAPEPVAPEQTAPSSPVQPQTTEKPPVSTSAAETACVSIQQVTSHVAKSAGKSIVASAADRFCVHTVAATNECARRIELLEIPDSGVEYTPLPFSDIQLAAIAGRDGASFLDMGSHIVFCLSLWAY